MKRTQCQIFLIATILLFCSNYSISETSYNQSNERSYDYPSEDMDSNSLAPNDYNSLDSQDNTMRPSDTDSSDDSNLTIINKKPDYYDHDDIDEDDNNVLNNSSSESRLPSTINSYGEKVIIVNPKVHAWGAYTEEGKLVRTGLASAGAKWCPDINRPCRTKVGQFRISSLGNKDCISSRYPVEKGGAPMPYCMYFNANQGIHGSHELAEANISHGCVRVSVNDAKWIRYNFASVGTKVIILSYY